MKRCELGTIGLDPSGPVTAGNEGRWVFTYTAGARGIAVGGCLVIRPPRSSAAPMHLFEWEMGQVRCYSESQARLVAAVRDFNAYYSPGIAVTVHGNPVLPGEQIKVVMGEVTRGSLHRLARAPWNAHPDVGFTVWVDSEGSGDLEPLPYYPHVAVVAGPAARLRASVPAVAAQGGKIRVVVSAEDRYTNVSTGFRGELTLTGAAPDNTPRVERGRCQLDAVAGGGDVRRITVSMSGPDLTAVSNACWSEPVADRFNLYFGDLHAQMCKDPSRYPYAWISGDPADLYDYARNVAGLDFVAHVEADEAGPQAVEIARRLLGVDPERRNPAKPGGPFSMLPPTISYHERMAAAERHNEPGRFVAFAAYEWGGRPCHRNVIFRNEPGHCFYGVAKTPEELMLCREADGVPSLSIPHTINASDDHSRWDEDKILDAEGYFDYAKRYHVGSVNWRTLDWERLDTAGEPVIELCQSRGSFETDTAGNGVILGGFGASAQQGLAMGKRVGFVGGTDTHLGRPGGRDCFGPTIDDRRGAITGVLAPELTRESVFDAIRARRCYAATDRILLDVRINGRLMGEEIPAADAQQRQVTIRVSGTAPIERVDIVRNNVTVHVVTPAALDVETGWNDPEALDALLETSPSGTLWYYVRVRQTDGEMAWSSPIWVIQPATSKE